ncbi:acyl-CoA dehydrogenase family protein [Amycolatopsis sp.]|uniref:acyl-CoA dehydrogenase family protein n=1 Tax=Amycolatopsis sp. TaxID=37632 RepID=UPI002B9E4E85|nr:acyl-CoA dehydrogenase family protein [Amycolatopsis sp.]HVV09277.1 acyl-CoA dehydrogenase family protein [Amycolatopsis sp.]
MTSQTVEEFERDARAFLAEHLPPRPPTRRKLEWGAGEDTGVDLWEEPDSEEERERLAEAREWRRKRFDAGYGWLSGPPELGGRGLPGEYARAYRRLEREFDVPNDSYFKLDHVIGPVLLKYATEEIRRTVPRALQRDLVACELFSEPEAGSDLFSARTRAVRDGGSWRITGQKVWTSDAHLADIGIVFCRSGNERGKGAFSTFVLDMHQPGVRVVPLTQMTGGAAFNEVYLDDAVVEDAALLGEVGQGWDVVREILARERAGIGGGMGKSGSGIANGTRFVELVRAMGVADDPLVRQELVKVLTGFWAARQLGVQGSDKAATPFLRTDPVPLVSKLALSANLRAGADFVSRVLGPSLVADTGEWGTFSWNSFLLGEPGVHIFAGTDEIVRNSIAEKCLGMPRD